MLYIIIFFLLFIIFYKFKENFTQNVSIPIQTNLPLLNQNIINFNKTIDYDLINKIYNYFISGININYISYSNILNDNNNTNINLLLIKTFKKLYNLGKNITINDIIAEIN